VAKLTTVALKKHEMRNDDLVTIRPPNRSGKGNDRCTHTEAIVMTLILYDTFCTGETAGMAIQMRMEV
jgi:hypothetical protein